MIVLSLFDGISCGRLALERAGIPVEKYYASEIDKYVIQISQKNYPDNIQLGDVTKWKEWDIDWSSIDLLIGGSPCQTFSNAGTRTGFDGKSGLFYTYLEILNHLKLINPNIKFLLENVKMKSEWRDEITRCMGVEPVLINSALVSAQQRNRYYWCNWQVEQPQDKHIVLKDILLSGKAYKEKADCLTASYSNATFNHDYQRNQRTMIAEPVNLKTYCRDFGTKGKIMTVEDEKTQCLTSSMGTGGGNVPVVAEPIRIGQIGKGGQGQRIYSVKGKSVSLNANGGGQGAKTGLYKIDLPDGDYIVRKLLPVECERLQTLPDNWTEGVSATQRYKQIGNGWTVDVIAHIFSTIDKPKVKETLF